MEGEFSTWLQFCCDDGSIDVAELEDTVKDPVKCYELFMECWQMDRHGTGLSAQKEIQHFLMRWKNWTGVK